MSADPNKFWVLLEYGVDDGVTYEVHRWIVPSGVTLEEVMESVDASGTIDRESVRIYSVGVWE